MKNYHLMVEGFHPDVLDATERLFRSDPWRDTRRSRHDKFSRWVVRASRVYGIDAPVLVVDPNDSYLQAVCGMTDAGGRTIWLARYSVTTLLHEFRHVLQERGTVDATYGDGVEDDARAWSQSLFHLTRPELYARAVETGGILYP